MPVAAEPDATLIAPEVPTVEAPDDIVTAPLMPDVPAVALPSVIEPLLVALPAPERRDTEPPVAPLPAPPLRVAEPP